MKTTIEINGRLYDAKTGKIVSSSVNTSNNHQKPAKLAGQGVVMDGVSKTTNNQPTVLTKAKPSASYPKPTQSSKPFAQDIKRPKPHTPAHINAHKGIATAQKSQTLSRKVVKKPNVSQKPAVHAKSTTPNATIHSRVEHSATGRGLLVKRIPETRLTRAMIAPKSALISKFGRSSSTKPQLSPHLNVKSAPSNNANHHPSTTSHQLDKPVSQVDPSVASAPIKKSVFEDHLLKANSHQKKPVNKAPIHKRALRKLKVSPKVASLTAGVFALVLLGGFFTYQNVPSIGMRVAANKAGFDGKLPGGIPAGYSFKAPIHAEQGNIALTYKSRSDNRQFIINQKPTNWSSESLLNNYLVDSQYRYQVYRDKGLTVYVYNGSNATWVDKGVWYNVSSQDGTLSSEQLLEIASSI